MKQLNSQIKIDRAVGAADNISPGEKTMRNSSKKTPWHLRLGENWKTAATAIVVGIALLAGATSEVHGQGQCDPPLNNVCFHKKTGEGGWSSEGRVEMIVDFDVPSGKSNQLYEIVWRGLKRVWDWDLFRYVETYENDPVEGLLGSSISELKYTQFWWPEGITEDSYESYGVELYEGHWKNDEETGERTRVRDRWVGSASLYNHQEAAEVNVDALLFSDFNYWTYYCEVDWDPPGITPLKYGYILGCWYWDARQSDYIYTGVHGSPRFDYGSSCSYEFSPRQFVGGFCNGKLGKIGIASFPRFLD